MFDAKYEHDVNVATFSRRLNFLLRNGEGNTIRPHCLIEYEHEIVCIFKEAIYLVFG